MQRRYKANGSHVRGMFWYQGCADAFDGTADTFEERMLSFIASFRNDFGLIPIIQVQLARVVHPMWPGDVYKRQCQHNQHREQFSDHSKCVLL